MDKNLGNCLQFLHVERFLMFEIHYVVQLLPEHLKGRIKFFAVLFQSVWHDVEVEPSSKCAR